MQKLLWVALPLLAAATLFAVQALRRRPPTRLALNVWSSVLLLAYVLTTAGLGIFWVANQQLPVFDWHYLFGYGTVLLVALHLALNFRIVWRYLARPVTAPATRHAPAAPGRRQLLDALGLLLAGGAAFALGMRHGRSELRVESPPPDATDIPPGPSTAALALVERFHAFSSHSRSGVLLRAPGVEWRDPPATFKRYPGVPRVTLPAPRGAPGGAVDLAALGSVLWHTVGVTDRRSGLNLRASPSSGALFPTELYAAVRSISGLLPGLWHYDPQAHALERLRDGVPQDAALGAAGEPGLRDAAAVILATAVFHRTGHKYRDRTYRYVLADLGHALENLRVSAAAAGFSARFVTGFDESQAAATLDVDEGTEGVLALTILGEAGAGTVPAHTATRWMPPRFSSGAGSPPDVTSAMHAATSLRDAAQAKASPVAPTSSAAAAPENLIRLPAAMAMPANMLGIIARRRSVRRFAKTPLPLAALAARVRQLRTQVLDFICMRFKTCPYNRLSWCD